MSKRPQRKFETGFKKQLVAQIQAGQITATEAARAHSISPTVISLKIVSLKPPLLFLLKHRSLSPPDDEPCHDNLYPLLLWGERKKWTPAKRYFKQNNTPS